MPTPRATGRRDPVRSGWIVFERSFGSTPEDVWSAVTRSERLARWIGTWEGDPASGSVRFTLTAEGDDAPAEDYAIEECRPPVLLVVSAAGPDGDVWRLRLAVEGTTLFFSQVLDDPELASSVGPGWDYYLDRLVAAETGGDVEALRFDSYYPALAEHYRRLAAGPG